MGRRKHYSRSYWERELVYLERTRSTQDLSNFNNDRACYNRYVDMQVKFASEDSFDDLAQAIIQTKLSEE